MLEDAVKRNVNIDKSVVN